MIALLTVPTEELLKLYAELVEAYYGKNGFGSDTAEIYAYRMQSYSPLAHNSKSDAAREHEAKLNYKSAQALVELVEMFTDHYGCQVEIDGVPYKEWDLRSFHHRAHVRVIR